MYRERDAERVMWGVALVAVLLLLAVAWASLDWRCGRIGQILERPARLTRSGCLIQRPAGDWVSIGFPR